jgi:transcription factor SPN1
MIAPTPAYSVASAQSGGEVHDFLEALQKTPMGAPTSTGGAPTSRVEEEDLQDFFGDLQTEIGGAEEKPASQQEEVESEKGDLKSIPTIIPPFKYTEGRKKLKVRHSNEALVSAEDEEGPNLSKKWTEVMDSLKLQKPFTINEMDSTPFIQGFIEDMVTAAEADLKEYYSGHLGRMKNKINMLARAVSIMQKVVFGELFVTFGGSRALALWLKPLPNGQLNNVHLRSTLLTCMLRLPISKDALQNCKDPALGEIVKNLMQNPRETVQNRKTAASLVQKWIKQVLVNKDAAETVQNEDEDTGPSLEPKPLETAESFHQLEEESFKRLHPTIPVREGKDYRIHPEVTAMARRAEKYSQDSNRYKLNEVLKIFNRPNKKAWKPYEVSIAGRQLNQL